MIAYRRQTTSFAVDSEPSDEILVDRCRSGDGDALACLIERHQHELYCVLLRWVCNEEDARDLLQDTMIAVARGVFSFRADSVFTAWAKAVAFGRFQDWLRRRYVRHHGQHEPIDDEPEGLPSFRAQDPQPDEALVESEERKLVHEAIAELKPECQEVITLVDLTGLQYNEAGDVLQINPKTVSTRLVRCREKLEPILRRLFRHRAELHASNG